MKKENVPILLFALNIVLLLFVAAKGGSDEKFDKITAREFEIVNEKGVRQLSIKTESDGTVVFRMMDETGTIRIKLAADKDGSGLVLLNEGTEPAIHILAKKEGGKFSLQDRSGKKREF